MSTPIKINVRQIDGEAVIDSQAMMLLFGVAAERLTMIAGQSETGLAELPQEWIQRGRRRAREASAHTGSEAMLDTLHYWARKDFGADLEVGYR